MSKVTSFSTNLGCLSAYSIRIGGEKGHRGLQKGIRWSLCPWWFLQSRKMDTLWVRLTIFEYLPCSRHCIRDLVCISKDNSRSKVLGEFRNVLKLSWGTNIGTSTWRIGMILTRLKWWKQLWEQGCINQSPNRCWDSRMGHMLSGSVHRVF